MGETLGEPFLFEKRKGSPRPPPKENRILGKEKIYTFLMVGEIEADGASISRFWWDGLGGGVRGLRDFRGGNLTKGRRCVRSVGCGIMEVAPLDFAA